MITSKTMMTKMILRSGKTYLSLIFILSLSLFQIGCSSRHTTIDFTKPGSFTEGIEGPSTDKFGNIYAVNFEKQGTIGKVTPDGQASTFLELPNGSIGNGIRFNKEGQMFVADYTNHNILLVDMNSRNISVYAHEPTANQPNDLTISESQIIYASDPNWSESTGKLWMVTRENGFTLLEDNMGTTNGIEVDDFRKRLYVNESVQRKIWVYDILGNGRVNNKRLFYSFEDFGLDGMRADREGNLYVCRYDKGTVVVIDPDGQKLNEYQLKGKRPSNITFSNDYNKCFITMADRGCLELITL